MTDSRKTDRLWKSNKLRMMRRSSIGKVSKRPREEGMRGLRIIVGLMGSSGVVIMQSKIKTEGRLRRAIRAAGATGSGATGSRGISCSER